jgi:L-ascorbate metabolism protein UlaG (beta-lactamase superfamily)
MKKLLCTVLTGCALLLATPQELFAQSPKPIINYHKNPEAYLARQAEENFLAIDQALDAHPPVVGPAVERRIALYSLDLLLHDTRNDNSEAMQEFVQSRIHKVLKDIKQPVKSGMKIYKLYNEACVARTKDVTIAFDLVRGRSNGKSIIPDELIIPIVKKCDALFLTHSHGDHVDRFVVDMFLAAGKPVIAPPTVYGNNPSIKHYHDEFMMIKKQVKLKKGKTLNVKIYPGRHAGMANNVYAVTLPNGMTVAHTGDQSGKQGLSWIAEVKNDTPRIDALIINCWTYKLPLAIEGFNPRYVFTGHENEMGHTIDHREAFWLTFKKLEDVKHDYVVLGWGEWFQVDK